MTRTHQVISMRRFICSQKRDCRSNPAIGIGSGTAVAIGFVGAGEADRDCDCDCDFDSESDFSGHSNVDLPMP